MLARKVTVTAAVTMIVGGQTGDEARSLGAAATYPAAAVIRNPSGGAAVYLGGVDVNTTQGWPLAAGEDIEVDLVGEILYGVTGSGSVDLYVLRRGF